MEFFFLKVEILLYHVTFLRCIPIFKKIAAWWHRGAENSFENYVSWTLQDQNPVVDSLNTSNKLCTF